MYENLKPLPAPLLSWYEKNRRILPFREDPQPYHIWLSEIMLQQTRVEAALPYYERFLEALPHVRALAEADEATLLKLWEGLGYYSRVRNLQKAAQIIVKEHGGVIPSEYEELLALPGIGEYTAGAISSIAYGKAEPAVDGNVLRIVSRICADSSNIASAKTKSACRMALKPLYPEGRAGDFTQALMELGAMVCLPNGAPRCDVCPAMDFCLAHQQGKELDFPVKPPKKSRKIEERVVYILRFGEKILLHQRAKKGLLAGIWELPNTLKGDGLPFPISGEMRRELGAAKHIFSHIEWHMEAVEYHLSEEISAAEGWQWFSVDEIKESIALPSAFSAYVKEL